MLNLYSIKILGEKSKAQLESIQPKFEQIKRIVRDDETIKTEKI